ncbi:MAG: PH domain-containing protein [bacterium]|nr:PH domain-containing protein [bacterium]
MKSFLSIFKESTNSFDGQEDGEKVLLLLRRHPFIFALELSFYTILILLPIAIGMIFSSVLYSYNVFPLFLFVASVYFLFIWCGIMYSFTLYALNVWIITDRRVIENAQKGLFNRVVSELRLSKVQDVTVQTEGVMQTFLNFGNLYVQTAGKEERFKFIQIPNPEKAKDEIMNLIPHGSPSSP